MTRPIKTCQRNTHFHENKCVMKKCDEFVFLCFILSSVTRFIPCRLKVKMTRNVKTDIRNEFNVPKSVKIRGITLA